MSLKTFLTPRISQWLLSRERLLRQRAQAERRRLRSGAPHELLYFHQVDDPYSALAAQSLSQLTQRYDVHLQPFLVPPPRDDVAPERERLVAYSRSDAQWLARRHGLWFQDPGHQPAATAVERISHELWVAIETGTFAQRAPELSRALWESAGAHLAEAAEHLNAGTRLTDHLRQADERRQRLGHYLGATFYYGGEWYWGIDRLHHLEKRLQALGAQRQASLQPALLFPPLPELPPQPLLGAGLPRPTLEFFFSFRSPYSAIVAPRVFELARQTGAQVQLRYVLPMVMRGLPVPRSKRRYISLDTAREAHERGIDFGRLQDPVGRPTERGLSLMPLAERHGRGQAYMLAFMHAVWAQGVDAGSDRGLRQIVEAAGLPWNEAREALHDPTWREIAEDNRKALFAAGLWGVPSFRTGNVAVWGQDRLSRIQEELLRMLQEAQA